MPENNTISWFITRLEWEWDEEEDQVWARDPNFLSSIDLDAFCKQMDLIWQLRLLKKFQQSFILTTSQPQQSPSSKGNIMCEADKWVHFTTLIAAAKFSQFGPKVNSIVVPETMDFETPCLNFANSIRKRSVYFSNQQDDLPIVIDSGMTPNCSDFIDELRPAPMNELNGLSLTTAVGGFGTVEWMIRDLFGTTRTICTQAYYVPQATICLFSPQAYFQAMHAGQYVRF
jgi:hypothetical protein